jgi:hypothetical protein
VEDLLQPATNHTSAYASHTSQHTSAEDLLQPATNHTSAYASHTSQHTSAEDLLQPATNHASAYVSMRRHTSAWRRCSCNLATSACRMRHKPYVRHTSAYVRIPGDERLPHASAIRQHRSAIRQAYVSTREDTWRRAPAACVSIRQAYVRHTLA